ncbi:hypothetical protein ARMGADRAFT_1009904 [Armillaria gallica]|uniref:Uncharacterized protein n=1 Tax=Armillaria gallica TaxID=47427 RepID=A0A2H3EBT0_ARMGA|nr:hypothetical protein ARMGADRAFT_1009904 [Armillaria gallica]
MNAIAFSHKSRGSGPMHCEARLVATAKLLRLRERHRPLFAPPDVGITGLGHGGGGPEVFLKKDICKYVTVHLVVFLG